MMYLEMSRDDSHGGGTWAFPNCVWAPTEKAGGGKWPFWSKVLDVRAGDTVLHLRGITPSASFVGYSRAAGDGFVTSQRPPESKGWSFAKNFFRADLEDYTPFHAPINLVEVFDSRRSELESYFDANKARGVGRSNIFFVRQAGRLQCLNGAYFTDVDDELFEALFGSPVTSATRQLRMPPLSVETGWQVAKIKARLGQAKFSAEIKRLYGGQCCFPGCQVNDSRFLVGAHIARWSDNESLRGNLGNGLCFCLFHDRAFELGLFTLDEHHRVYVSPREMAEPSALMRQISEQHGIQIKLAEVLPLADALLEHWIRVDLSP